MNAIHAAAFQQPITPPDPALKETFQKFVGETFFSQLMSSMRKTTHGAEYLHGGAAEEVFQGQLDQALVEQMTKASAAQFADPMYELFTTMRRP